LRTSSDQNYSETKFVLKIVVDRYWSRNARKDPFKGHLFEVASVGITERAAMAAFGILPITRRTGRYWAIAS